MKKQILIMLTTFLLVSTASAQLPPEKNTSLVETNIEQTSRLSQITNNLLSVSLDQSTVQPGETVTGEISDPISAVGDYGEPAECDGDTVEIKIDWFDPSGDNVATDYLSADECDFYSLDWSFNVWDNAETGEWEVQAEYRHENVGDLTGDKVYDFGSDTYEVVDSTTTDPEPEPEPEPEPDPEPSIELTQTPGFSVDEDSNTVTGSLEISNNGDGDMSSYNIVEMQVRPEGSNPLSFVGSQQVCDESNRNNVNKEYRLDSGDTRDISLQNEGDLSDGESYTVYFLTRSSCGGEKVEPIYNSYNAGTFTLEAPQTQPEPEPEPEDQSVEQVSKPQISVTGDTVTGEVSFKNTGGSMPDKDIVEMQVRPKGQTPLAFSSNQQVCDQSNPGNVHKEYDLSSGETDSTSLTVSGLDDGEYTVYFLTREGCAPDNDKVEPYYNSVNAGTVTVSTTGDGDGSSVGFSTTLLLAGGIGVLALFSVLFVIGGVLYWKTN